VLDDYHQAASKTLDHFLKAAIMEAPANVRIFLPAGLRPRPSGARNAPIAAWESWTGTTQIRCRRNLQPLRCCGMQGNGSLIANLSQKTLGWAAGLILLLERTRIGDAF